MKKVFENYHDIDKVVFHGKTLRSIQVGYVQYYDYLQFFLEFGIDFPNIKEIEDRYIVFYEKISYIREDGARLFFLLFKHSEEEKEKSPITIDRDDLYLIFRCDDAFKLLPIVEELIRNDIRHEFVYRLDKDFLSSIVHIILPYDDEDQLQVLNKLCDRLEEEK